LIQAKKIVVLGPESTGKSELSIYLAQHYNTVFVTEYAREYLETKQGIYNELDLDIIAQHQKLSEDAQLKNVNHYLFCDTNILVLQVWSEIKYNACTKLILDMVANTQTDLYLLMDIDLPWQYDALREAPELQSRQQIFLHYLEILQSTSVPFAIINGIDEKRNENAINQIDLYFNTDY
jgi:NadR type nicotinamide-nucleotide adenylyltransferase